jgi:Putative MetA-pathway of phenol degradation
MFDQQKIGRSTVLSSAVLAALCAAAAPAQAQITRGFIGAHEYALPDPKGMKPWNVFVEYSTLQNTSKAWNANGDKTSVGKTEVLVSLSKFVHFWEVVPDVGIAMELIVPKVGIRDKGGLGANSASGIADPIVGPAFWIKPSPNWTLGTDMAFLQIPLGDSDVGGGKRWNAIASVFWDGQFDKLNWTGNIGTTIFGKGDDGSKLGPSVYVNNRLGYRVSQLIEPYVGIDYERQQAKSGNPSNHEWGAAAGVMFYALDKGHISVHYQKGS